MVSHDRLVALWLGCRVNSSGRGGFSEGRFTEVPFDAIIDGKVNCPGGKISKEGWTQTSVHASNTVVSQCGLDDVWRAQKKSHVRVGRMRQCVRTKDALVAWLATDCALCL